MKASTVLRFLAPLAFFAAGSASATEWPSDDIEIKGISAIGSGCPSADSLNASISEDARAFTLTFSEFAAEVGPGLPLSGSRKNCVIALKINVPAGWQYSIGSFYYRGFMDLEKGIKANHNTRYWFTGQSETAEFNIEKKGQYSDSYTYAQQVGIASQVWGPCSVTRDLNINTSVSVRNENKVKYPNSQGFIANDSVDGEIQQVWGISWRRC